MNIRVVRRLASESRARQLHSRLSGVGIDCWLEFDAEVDDAPWLLVVSEAELEAALRLLGDEGDSVSARVPPVRLLGANRSLGWVLGLIAANVAVWLAMEAAGGPNDPLTVLRFGAIRGVLVEDGQWWRLVSALFVQLSPGHLVGNMAVLAVIGTLALRAWGPGRLLFLYVSSGVLGNLAGMLFGSSTAIKAGASGAILGLLGAFAGARLIAIRQAPHASRFKSWHVVAMLLAFYGLVVGARPQSDHIAHLGGLLGGAVLAMTLPVYQEQKERRAQIRLGGLAVAACLLAAVLCVRAALRP